MKNYLNSPHQDQQVVSAGKPLSEAKAAMILLHGRGATAPSILDLATYLHHPDFAYLAPQASGNSWYPHSFLMEIETNEPGLSSALRVIAELVAQIAGVGVSTNRIILAGFSQGACLASEFVARNAQTFDQGLGGLLAFSGGLIGPPGVPREYIGSLDGMPAFMGCSNVDFHIPEERVHETANVLTHMGAVVDKQIYPNMGHTIIQDELDRANRIINSLL